MGYLIIRQMECGRRLSGKEQKTATLAKRTSEKMLKYITENALAPGERLGTEKDLAEELGVSRSTIREAIKILVSRNILEVKQGSGTYISELRGIVEDPLGLGLISDRLKLTWDLLEVRMMIEPSIAYMAAMNATESQLAELEALCDEMEVLTSKNMDRRVPDIRFHVGVAEASGNLVAPNLIPIIDKAVELFVHYTRRERAPETVATHREILEGLKRRDPEWARDMMSMHLAFNRQELRKIALEQGKSFNNYDRKERGIEE